MNTTNKSKKIAFKNDDELIDPSVDMCVANIMRGDEYITDIEQYNKLINLYNKYDKALIKITDNDELYRYVHYLLKVAEDAKVFDLNLNYIDVSEISDMTGLFTNKFKIGKVRCVFGSYDDVDEVIEERSIISLGARDYNKYEENSKGMSQDCLRYLYSEGVKFEEYAEDLIKLIKDYSQYRTLSDFKKELFVAERISRFNYDSLFKIDCSLWDFPNPDCILMIDYDHFRIINDASEDFNNFFNLIS